MRFSDEAVLRMVVSVALGAAIGFERETNEQPAGLRTHIAVSLGACLFGIVSTLGFDEFEAERSTTNVQIDVTRVASQVVVGIGFLGAGIIFRQGTVVRNLTTAASLWVTSAVGLTAGVGDLGTAAVAAGIMLVALVALLPIRNLIRQRASRDARELRIRLVDDAGPGDLIADLHDLEGVTVERLSVQKDAGAYVVVVELKAHRLIDLDERVGRLSRRDDVRDLADVLGKET
jgi:putative Mg2+ transporter-C (MgtC) family protein